MSATELGTIPADVSRSRVKVIVSEPILTEKWLMFEQDDACVCLSKRQAEMLQRYLEDFTEGR